MTTKAAKALKSLKTLPADEIGSLKSVKASEMSSDIRCQNHAEKEALRKQINIWYQDQNDAVRKLSQDQQQAFRNLIKFQNDKRRIQRQSYIQKQRAIQQTLREQAIKDREAAARRFLEGSMKKGKKKIIQRQKEKMGTNLDDIEENTSEVNDVEFGSNTKSMVGDESVDEGCEMIEEKSDTHTTESQQGRKGIVTKKDSMDSGIATTILSSDSQNSFANISDKLPENPLTEFKTMVDKPERKVTFVEENTNVTDTKSNWDETSEVQEIVDNITDDVIIKTQSISHHHVTVIDGETGHVEILPRQKTRIVDETAFLRKEVGDMSLKSKKTPDIMHRAHLKSTTSERQRQNTSDAVAMPTRMDSDLDRITSIARENGNTHYADDTTVTLSRMNTTSSILPSISEDTQVDIQPDENHHRLVTIDQTGKTDHVASDSSAIDTSPAKSFPAQLSATDALHHYQTLNDSDEEGVLADSDGVGDDEAARRAKIREKRMRERRKLEDDMHKYHVGIANRTFKIPQYEAPPVPRVPVYTRNSVGSLVASEKTVRLASEDFKLPSRRQEYLIKKALEWEEARKEVREKKLREFLAKMKDLEQSLPAKKDLTKLTRSREPFQNQKRDSISHNTMKSTVFGRALATGSRYNGENADVNDLRNCRYIRQTSIDDTSSSHDDSYETRRRKRALDKVSSWGPLGVPHGGSSRTKKRSAKQYLSI